MNRIERLLSSCSDVNGVLSSPQKALFRAYFYDPTQESWHAIRNEVFFWYGIGKLPARVWDSMTRRYPHMYSFIDRTKRGPKCWKQVPDVFSVYQVMTSVLLVDRASQKLDTDW